MAQTCLIDNTWANGSILIRIWCADGGVNPPQFYHTRAERNETLIAHGRPPRSVSPELPEEGEDRQEAMDQLPRQRLPSSALLDHSPLPRLTGAFGPRAAEQQEQAQTQHSQHGVVPQSMQIFKRNEPPLNLPLNLPPRAKSVPNSVDVDVLENMTSTSRCLLSDW